MSFYNGERRRDGAGQTSGDCLVPPLAIDGRPSCPPDLCVCVCRRDPRCALAQANLSGLHGMWILGGKTLAVVPGLISTSVKRREASCFPVNPPLIILAQFQFLLYIYIFYIFVAVTPSCGCFWWELSDLPRTPPRHLLFWVWRRPFSWFLRWKVFIFPPFWPGVFQFCGIKCENWDDSTLLWGSRSLFSWKVLGLESGCVAVKWTEWHREAAESDDLSFVILRFQSSLTVSPPSSLLLSWTKMQFNGAFFFF